MAQVWEYNESLDTAKSFHAFGIYRDLGPNRTVIDAYRVYKGRNVGGSKADGYFERWATKADWVDRAKAFDIEQERLRLNDSSLEARRKHENRLEEVRSITEAISISRLKSSLRASILVRDTIAALEEKCKSNGRLVMDEKQTYFLLNLISVQNKDAATIEATLKLADESLNISGLIEQMQGKKSERIINT